MVCGCSLKYEYLASQAPLPQPDHVGLHGGALVAHEAGPSSSLCALPLGSLHSLGLWQGSVGESAAALPSFGDSETKTIAQSKWPLGLSTVVGADGLNVFNRPLNQVTKETRGNLNQVIKGTNHLGKVTYHRACRGLCRCREASSLGRLHALMMNVLEKTLRAQKAPSLLLVTKTISQDNTVIKEQRWLCSAWCPRAGAHEFRAVFIGCSPPADEQRDFGAEYAWEPPPSEVGSLLQLRRQLGPVPALVLKKTDPRCSAAFREPFASCRHLTAFDHHNERDWATLLLRDIDGQVEAGAHVLLVPVVSEEVGWDLLWTSWQPLVDEPITVSLAMASAAEEPSSASGFLAPEPKRRRAQRDEAEDKTGSMDLIQMLEEILEEDEKNHLTAMQEAAKSVMAPADGEDAEHDPAQESSSDDSDGKSVASDVRVERDDVSECESQSGAQPSAAVDEEQPAAPALDEEQPAAPGPDTRSVLQVKAERKRALTTSRSAGFKADVLRLYRVREVGQLWFDGLVPAPQSTQLGRIQPCFQGTTLCATCNSHPRCKFLLTAKPALGLSLLDVEADLVAWLAAGAELDAAQHAVCMNQCKRTFYQMTVRGENESQSASHISAHYRPHPGPFVTTCRPHG